MLALLQLDADRVVPMDRLVDDLWGAEVPETARKMVQIFISQLRKQTAARPVTGRTEHFPFLFPPGRNGVGWPGT